MPNEAWLNGKLEGFADVLMPTAHALTQAIVDLQKFTDLTNEELLAKPNNSPSIAFHLRHIAGSCDRLLTYAKGENLSELQFEFLRNETAESSELNAAELVNQAILAIESVLDLCQSLSTDILFEARFVGRKKLHTNIFGLLFHIAEHTARHVGQIITIAKIVKVNQSLPTTNLSKERLREIADDQISDLQFNLSLDPEWRETLFNSPQYFQHPITGNILSESSREAGLRFAAFNEGSGEDDFIVFGIISLDFPDIIGFTTNNPNII